MDRCDGTRYKLTGKLTIKNVTQAVAVLVNITTQGNERVYDGSLPIKRTQFNVGVGEWKDT